MNVSVHLQDSLGREVERAVKKTKKTRNALINEALRYYLEEKGRSRWPRAVIRLAGAARDLEPFEKSRQELGRLSEDPLA